LRARQATGEAQARRIHVRREDFHVTRFKQNTSTTAIFVVDASGSSALHRLAEAKGAVELLLADCYVRRDRVAVIAFRGSHAELLLPPTRSLARAKRSLAGLPGGGGTPLAAALDAARSLAESVRRTGDTPVVVMLTDGRANIARDGTPGRERATQDALVAAATLRACGASALLLDTSPQPQAGAQARRRAVARGLEEVARRVERRCRERAWEKTVWVWRCARRRMLAMDGRFVAGSKRREWTVS
jgi:magnesium chelatase subunit D